MHYTENAIIQNLKDAGCDIEIIETFTSEYKHGRQDKAIKLLMIHRRSLLDALHREQKRIDCLDYLVYMLQKCEKEQI